MAYQLGLPGAFELSDPVNEMAMLMLDERLERYKRLIDKRASADDAQARRYCPKCGTERVYSVHWRQWICPSAKLDGEGKPCTQSSTMSRSKREPWRILSRFSFSGDA